MSTGACESYSWKKKFHTQLKKGIILLTLWLSQSSLEIISRIFLNKLQRGNGFCVFNLPKFLGGISLCCYIWFMMPRHFSSLCFWGEKKHLQIILDVTSNCLDLTDKEDDITSSVPDPRFVCSGWQNPSPGNR